MPESNNEVPGWVILSPGAVPERWRSRAIPVVLVPLVPSETNQLLSDTTVEESIPATLLPLARFVARGLSAVEIARELGVTPRTVQRHVVRLSQNFGVSTLQQLATELASRGFGAEPSHIGRPLSQDDVTGDRMDISGDE